MTATAVSAPRASPVAQLSFIDRFLPLWIFVAMAAGLGLGRIWPGLGAQLDRVQLAGVSVPIAFGLLWMMYPVLAKVLIWNSLALGTTASSCRGSDRRRC